jgi:hypothetical protein
MNLKNRLDKLEAQNPPDDEVLVRFVVKGYHPGNDIDEPKEPISPGTRVRYIVPKFKNRSEIDEDFIEQQRKKRVSSEGR